MKMLRPPFLHRLPTDCLRTQRIRSLRPGWILDGQTMIPRWPYTCSRWLLVGPKMWSDGTLMTPPRPPKMAPWRRGPHYRPKAVPRLFRLERATWWSHEGIKATGPRPSLMAPWRPHGGTAIAPQNRPNIVLWCSKMTPRYPLRDIWEINKSETPACQTNHLSLLSVAYTILQQQQQQQQQPTTTATAATTTNNNSNSNSNCNCNCNSNSNNSNSNNRQQQTTINTQQATTSSINDNNTNNNKLTNSGQQTTNNKQQTTNNTQQTTNNKQQTTNDKQQTTNNKQQTTNNK